MRAALHPITRTLVTPGWWLVRLRLRKLAAVYLHLVGPLVWLLEARSQPPAEPVVSTNSRGDL